MTRPVQQIIEQFPAEAPATQPPEHEPKLKAPHAKEPRRAVSKPEVVVTLRPRGRGNWATVELRIGGKRAPPPMFYTPGQRVEIGGHEFRVSKVVPA